MWPGFKNIWNAVGGGNPELRFPGAVSFSEKRWNNSRNTRLWCNRPNRHRHQQLTLHWQSVPGFLWQFWCRDQVYLHQIWIQHGGEEEQVARENQTQRRKKRGTNDLYNLWQRNSIAFSHQQWSGNNFIQWICGKKEYQMIRHCLHQSGLIEIR